MEKEAKILITGANGMVGSALYRLLNKNGYRNVLTPPKSELNLLNKSQVEKYFSRFRPQYVFMIAAKVGGIAANQKDPVGFLNENTLMQSNLFEICHRYPTNKNLFLGSSCIYPRECPQPMKEEYLLTGPLEPTNEGYALAKIVGLKLAQYYYQQYGLLTVCPMPCNIYGTGDHFDLGRSHVLSALIRRFVDARDLRIPLVTLWGTGKAQREFIHVDDVAQVMLFLMDKSSTPNITNVGTGTDISIAELATRIAKETGYSGDINWDHGKPDGMPRKCLDISRLKQMGFETKIGLIDGIRQTIREYEELKKGGKIE